MSMTSGNPDVLPDSSQALHCINICSAGSDMLAAAPLSQILDRDAHTVWHSQPSDGWWGGPPEAGAVDTQLRPAHAS